ncbi:MAG: TolC family protein [Steroidobacteraceae bacterium]
MKQAIVEFFTAAGLAALCGSAQAETLRDAWQMALASDATIAAAAEDVAAGYAQLRAARAQRWPTLSAGANYMQFDHAPALELSTPQFSFTSPPIFDNDETLSTNLQLSMPIFTGGRINNSIRQANAQHRAVQASSEQYRQDRLQTVATAFFNVRLTQQQLEAASANVEQLRSHVRDVGIMVQREVVARNDLLAARVALADAEQKQLQADNQSQLAWAEYNRLVGMDTERRVDLVEQPGFEVATDDEPLEKLLESVADQRPAIVALGAQTEALGAAARATAALQLPQLSLVAAYSHLETTVLDRQDFRTIGVGLNWAIFDSGQTRQRAAALRRTAAASRLRLDDQVSAAKLEVRRAWLARDEARGRVKVSTEAVAEAEENLRIARELYGAGLATNTQVLEAVALRIGAIGNRDRALFDSDLARINLARAAGRLQ